jgi:undecaprenyl pyrophosphate synthase
LTYLKFGNINNNDWYIFGFNINVYLWRKPVIVQTKVLQNIDTKIIPEHLAIIMDGNGRWAKQQGDAETLSHESRTNQ